MTKDEIMSMAREAGLANPMVFFIAYQRFADLVASAERRKHLTYIEFWKQAAMTAEKWRGFALSKDSGGNGSTVQHLQQEAAAVEREACAKLCDNEKPANPWKPVSSHLEGQFEMAGHLAERIRARGNP